MTTQEILLLPISTNCKLIKSEIYGRIVNEAVEAGSKTIYEYIIHHKNRGFGLGKTAKQYNKLVLIAESMGSLA